MDRRLLFPGYRFLSRLRFFKWRNFKIGLLLVFLNARGELGFAGNQKQAANQAEVHS